MFLRDTYEQHLSIDKADNKQSNCVNEWNNFEKGTKSFGKRSFLNNLVLILSAREKFLIALKGDRFQ